MGPIARTTFDGQALVLDFPGLTIGVAEYDEGPTGVTVFGFPGKAALAVDVRGGSPGTMMTDLFRLGHGYVADAVCLCGGSAFGLEAATGVMAEILAARHDSTRWFDIPVVPAAVVYDFNGRENAVHPDKALGRAAWRTSRPGRFPLGARGAGRFVHVGGYFGPDRRERSGQGGAFRRVGPIRIAVFTVINSVGAVIDRQGRAVLGNRDPKTGHREPVIATLRGRGESGAGPNPRASTPPSRQNTTLTLVVTDQALSPTELARLAVQTHASMARAIDPFHTARDGDTLFAASTGGVKDGGLDPFDMATHAADLAWEAVLAAVPRDS